jgi:hypothetical protein
MKNPSCRGTEIPFKHSMETGFLMKCERLVDNIAPLHEGLFISWQSFKFICFLDYFVIVEFVNGGTNGHRQLTNFGRIELGGMGVCLGPEGAPFQSMA